MSDITMVCTSCGFVGNPKNKTQGSFWVEIFLWICGILPGVLYSVWRWTTRKKVCPACNNPTMIPTNTPRGIELLKQHHKGNEK